MYHMKSLALFTLSVEGPKMPMAITQWRSKLLTVDDTRSILVDCLEGDALATLRIWIAANLGGVIRWDGPRRSLASQGNEKRVTFAGYFSKGLSSEIDIMPSIGILKSNRELKGETIGSRSLFSNQASLLLEMRHPSALEGVHDLLEQAVFVSPRLAAITTSRQAEEWAARVTRLMTEDPLMSIEKLRFRTSLHGGRPWVKPELLEKTIRSSIAQAESVNSLTASVTNELSCLLVVGCAATADPSTLIAALMRKVTSTVGATWQRSQESTRVRPGTWRELNDATGQRCGKIQIHTTHVREVDALIAREHGCGVEVEGVCYTAEVENVLKSVATISSQSTATRPQAAPGGQGNAAGGPDVGMESVADPAQQVPSQ